MKRRFLLLSFFALTAIVSAQHTDLSSYYSAADGKCGAALKTALFNIITSHTNLGYDGLWTAYYTTDKRDDGKLYDIYSNTTNYVIGGSAQGANYSAEGDSYNREHLIPQSVFNEASPMKADAHFVYPADGYINNMRSNYPFGTVGTVTKTSNNGYSKLGSAASSLGYSGTVFEPNDEYKGDIARAILYVVTCYQDKLSSWDSWAMLAQNTYPSLSTWATTLLLAWSAADPVSQKEIDRNDAVDKLQGNRNPFVDYPGIEQYIWGSLNTTNVDLQSLADGTSSSVTRPEISPNGGTFSSSQSVTITCATSGATIYYTIDGTTPSKSSTLYTGAFSLTATATVKAIAYDSSDNASSVATATFTKSSSGSSVGSLLYESFSGYTSASDGTAAISTDNSNLDYSSWTTFDRLYFGGTNNGYNTSGCGKMGSGSYAGSMTASGIALTGDGTLTFKVKKYGSDTGTLSVTVSGATATGDTNVTPQTDWTDYTVNLTDGTGDVSITFATSAKRAYIDEIRLAAAGSETITAPDAPVFSPNGGNFTDSQSVTITCATSGTTIYYTTNGTTPTQSSTQYTGAITLLATTTIKAIAYDGSGNASEVTTATFTKTSNGSSTGSSLLYESFSNNSNSDDSNTAMDTSSTVLDYSGWTTLTNIYAGGTASGYNGGAYGKMGKSGEAGSMTAEGIALTGDGTLTFYLQKWGSDTGRLTVTVTGATATGDTDITPTDTWTKYTVNLTGGTGDVSITLATTSKRARIDEIELVSGAAEEETPATPTFSPAGGTYTSAQSVTISCATSGAVIHYTTDGTAPTASSSTYSSAISLTENGTYTIKAIAVSAGGTKTSSVETATYTINIPASKPDAPRFSLAGGTYTTPQSIQVVADEGCTITYYWGSSSTQTPDASYTIGNNAVSFSSAGTYYLKAYATKDGVDSDVTSATYVYNTSSSTSDSDVYELVTSASQLVEGKKYLIVASGYNYALSTTQNNNNRGATVITKNTTDNTVTATANTQILTLGGDATGGWSFHTGSGYLYAASSSGNYLRTQTSNNANGLAAITISSEGVASITFKGTNTRNQLKYNNSSTLFSCYSSGQQTVSLYVQQETSGSSDPVVSEIDDGIYRIRDAVGYLCINTDGTLGKTTDASDLGTIFTVVNNGSGSYTLEAQGKTIATYSGTTVSLGDDTTVSLTDGTNNRYIAVGDKYINADVKAGAVGAEWTFEEVETTDADLPTFTLNQPRQNGQPVGTQYYRTFFADFPFTLSSGTANIITTDGGMATTEAVSGTVPANTAVLIISDNPEVSIIPQAGDLSLTVIEENELVGTCQPMQVSSLSGKTVYTFQAKDGNVGFYRYTGTTLGANKAYLAVSGGNAPSFSLHLGDSTTGIGTIETGNAGNGAYYDLQGRRITNPAKGIYIRNGKKVLVR